MDKAVIQEYKGSADQWNSYVESHPEAKIYHLFEWKKVVERSFGHKVLYLAAFDKDRIAGILPLVRFNSRMFGKFLVSMPFFNYGGELVSNEILRNKFYSHLHQFILQQNLNFVEFRQDDELEINLPVRQHRVTFLLSLPDSEEDLWNGFKAKLRSQIRRPTKEGMWAKTGGLELLDNFYQIFSFNMRDLGTPVYSKGFFQNILETFPEQVDLVVVYTSENVPVAASLLIGYRDTMEIPWASSLHEYNRFSPNMLLYWHSIKIAISKGYKTFDFGRSAPDAGTYRFKQQWGGEEKNLYWYYILPNGNELPSINPQNPKYEMAIKIWQKLPVGLTRLIGPTIIKNIP